MYDLDYLNFTTGALSLVACLWLFHFISKIPSPRPVSIKLILALTVADFFYSISNILTAFDDNSDTLCMVEAVLREFSILSSLSWACCISMLTYETFSKGKGFDQRKFFRRACVMGCIVPAVYATIPAYMDKYSYGRSFFGCWILVGTKDQNPDTSERVILVMLFYGLPVIFALTLTLLLYGQVVKKIRELSSQLTIPTNIEITKLFWYPTVLFVAFVPSLLNDIYESAYPGHTNEFFTVLHIILLHTLGFTNAVVYGLQRKRYYEAYEQPYQSQSDIESAKLDDQCLNQSTGSDESDDDYSRRHRSSYYEHLISAHSADTY